jgi:hypothetical protein
MQDMTQVITPKSDQINADDLISGPRTITIREVQIKGGQEQPVSIYFEGSDKAFRPCKSMCRVLVAVWGPDANNYVGRSLTLYRDPAVKWGGMEVGGIRISHMTDMPGGALTLALTATKGSRKPYVVKPLTQQPTERRDQTLVLASVRNRLTTAAQAGMSALEAEWKSLVPDHRKALKDDLPNLKEMAAEADRLNAAEEQPPTSDPQPQPQPPTHEGNDDDGSPFA